MAVQLRRRPAPAHDLADDKAPRASAINLPTRPTRHPCFLSQPIWQDRVREVRARRSRDVPIEHNVRLLKRPSLLLEGWGQQDQRSGAAGRRAPSRATTRRAFSLSPRTAAPASNTTHALTFVGPKIELAVIGFDRQIGLVERNGGAMEIDLPANPAQAGADISARVVDWTPAPRLSTRSRMGDGA
ncbi:MAG: hypothetical protein B7Y84_00175 [Azorhizobium sp. 32-67-21]|nr:MAG: hypothetical protein B7Y84_00175 [Azorhizobium sp. 32-67-21]